MKHLTSELASLQHLHLKEKMQFEQQIKENSLKWESADSKLKIADQSDQSLREMLKRMEKANADLLDASSSHSDIWAQKVCFGPQIAFYRPYTQLKLNRDN